MESGTGKSKVNFKKLNLPLWGYGKLNHVSKGAETDLFARAFIFRTEKKVVALVNLECCIISHQLKLAVVDGLKEKLPSSAIAMENLMLCAQHTHSAPGGISPYPFFSITTQGFRPDIFEQYKHACVDALMKAYKDLESCKLYLNAGLFDAGVDVAFNRSLDAYNSNKDVKQLDEQHTHLAVDRMMKQIRICVSESDQKGLINWFGVQANSIGSENDRIHSDNKGYAASLLENDLSENRDFVAAFCAEACGDSSPNYHGRGKWWPRGKYEDGIKSAYFNGFLQFEKSKELAESPDHQIQLSDTLDSELFYADLSSLECNPEYCPDGLPHETGLAAAGLSLFLGSPIDNPGIDSFSSLVLAGLANYRRFIRRLPLLNNRKERLHYKKLRAAHGNKKIIVEMQDQKILGYSNPNRLSIPSMLAETVDEIRRQYQSGFLNHSPWIPVILPIQILIIGELAIVGFPGELTTVAGTRLKKTVLEKLGNRGIIDVIITCYANDYSGYATTYEEYQLQLYEGGNTLFGQYTLAGFQTCFARLADDLCKPEGKRSQLTKKLRPHEFSAAELKKRAFSQKDR
jgi:neutral ceramidase